MKFVKKYYFLILIVLLAIIRLVATFHLTAYEIGNAVVDDTYYVMTADYLKHGMWQGKFNNNTLIKGITFAFILNITSRLNISYINFLSLFYILSSLAITYSLKGLIKNRFFLLLIYVWILYNPAMFGLYIAQRVYRNGLVPSFSLLIMSCYFFILNNKSLKLSDIYLINIISGFLLGMFYNLREDSIWIFPFIIFMSIVLIIKLKHKENSLCKRIFLLLVPIFVLILINNVICFINYQYYGSYKRLDFVNSPFEKTYIYISKIDYPDTNIRESVSRSKLEYLFNISLSLSQYRKEIVESFKFYDTIDCNTNNNKVDNGWWQWTFRNSLNTTEVSKTFKSRDEYYNKVYKELKQSEKDGKIQLRKINFSEFFINFSNALEKSTKYVIAIHGIHSDIAMESYYASEMPIIDEWYKEITHDRFIYSEKDIKEYKIADLIEQNEYLDKYKYVSDNLNRIIKIYQFINPSIFIVSIVGYILSSIDLLRKKFVFFDTWIIMSSLIGTMLVMLFGYSYVYVTSFTGVLSYMYFAGIYGPMLLFETVAVYYLINKFRNIKFGVTNERRS